jgi:hypothetical protein
MNPCFTIVAAVEGIVGMSLLAHKPPKNTGTMPVFRHERTHTDRERDVTILGDFFLEEQS